jgi:hypothetical protein
MIMKSPLIIIICLALLFANCKDQETAKSADPVDEALKLIEKYDFSDNFFAGLEKIKPLLSSEMPQEKTKKVYELYYRGKLDAFLAGIILKNNNLLQKAINGKDLSPETTQKFFNDMISELDTLFKNRGDKFLQEISTGYRFVSLLQKQNPAPEEVKFVQGTIRTTLESQSPQPSVILSSADFLQNTLNQALADWEDGQFQKINTLLYQFIAVPETPVPFPDRNGDISRLLAFLKQFGVASGKISQQDPIKTMAVDAVNRLKSGLEGKFVSLPPKKDLQFLETPQGMPAIGIPSELPLDVKFGEPTAIASYNPLEVIIVTRYGIYGQARPVITFSKDSIKSISREAYGGDSKLLIIKDKLDKITKIEPLKEIVEGAKDLTERVKDLTAKVFVQGNGKGIFNAEREKDKKAVLLTVDRAARTEYFEVTMASLASAGYNDFRLVKEIDTGSAIPVLYKNDEYLKERKELKTHSRATVVFLFANSVEIYPPAGSREKINAPKPLPSMPPDVKVIEETDDKPKGFGFSYKVETGIREKLLQVLTRIDLEYGYSPIVHLGVKRGAKTETVLEAAGTISSATGSQIPQIEDIYPLIKCHITQPNCVTHIPIIFSNIGFGKAPPPPVQVIEDRPSGFCDKQSVAKVVTGKSGAIKACYEMQLQRHPELQGKLGMRWTINEDGTVSNISVVNTELNNKTVEDCVVKQISTMKFNKPEGGICVINWPFKFVPGD